MKYLSSGGTESDTIARIIGIMTVCPPPIILNAEETSATLVENVW
jgi:hypothetical protein